MAEFGLHGQLVRRAVDDSVAMDLLRGLYIKSISYDDTTGSLEIVGQDENAAEYDFSFSGLTPEQARDRTSTVFGLVSGQRLDQAIEAHPVAQHTWRHELRLDYRNPQAGAEPQFIIIQFGGGVRGLDFSNLSNGDRGFIHEVAVGDVVGVGGQLFTVTLVADINSNETIIRGTFDEVPALVNEREYRLRFTTLPPPSWDDITGKDDARPSEDQIDVGTNATARPWSVTDVLRAITMHAMLEGLLLPDPDSGVLRDPTEEDWDVANPVLAWNGHTFVRASRHVVSQTTRAVTTVDWDEMHGLASTQTFRGFHSSNTQVQNANTGDVYVNLAAVEWRTRYLVGWEHFSGPHVDPYSWTQFFRTRELMEAHFTAANQLGAYLNDNGHWRIKECTAVDEGDTVYGYHWESAFGLGTDDGLAEVAADFGPSVRHDIGFTAATSNEFSGWKVDESNIGIAGLAGQVGTPPTLIPDTDILAVGYRPDNIIVPDEHEGRYLVYVRTDDDDKYDGRQFVLDGEIYILSYINRVASDDVAVFGTVTGQLALGDGDHTMNLESSEPRRHPAIADWLWNATQGLRSHSGDTEIPPVSTLTAGGIKTLYESNSDTNAYTDDEKAAVATIGAGGGTREILFDNRLSTQPTSNAISIAAGNGWASSIDIAVSRQIVEADDNLDIRSRFEYVQNGTHRSFDFMMNAGVFRNFGDTASLVGTAAATDGYHPFLLQDGRLDKNTFGDTFSRLGMFTRARSLDGNDNEVARYVTNVTGNTVGIITACRGVIELVPSPGAAAAAAAAEQQAASSRRLVTRTVVSDDTLIAANNLTFDLDSSGLIGVGRFTINPTPIDDIVDFVATVRVGGRAGFPMYLSHEQLEYIGEHDIIASWPFGSENGVDELPCAGMYVDHSGSGVVKDYIRPQKRQVELGIQGTITNTVILIFFTYDAANENVTTVEMVAFTDQSIQVEGAHFHFWLDE